MIGSTATEFADNGGVRIAYDRSGPRRGGTAAAVPLLLIMGHAYPRTMWGRVLPTLAAHRTVVRMDNRGAGDSDAPAGPYRLEQMAADALAVLDAAGIGRADVYGVSLGGLVAQVLAAEAPQRVRRLVLGCTAAGVPSGAANGGGGWIYSLPRPLLARALTHGLYGRRPVAARIREDRRTLRRARLSPAGCRAQQHAIATARTEPRRIQAPTLVLHGDADRIVPLERAAALAAAVPDGRLVVLPGAGHNYLTDQPSESVAAVEAFLAESDEGPGGTGPP